MMKIMYNSGQERGWGEEDERAGRRHCFDDPVAGPSHAPLMEVGGEFEDIHRRLEAVLQGVLEGMWSRIQDEGVLE